MSGFDAVLVLGGGVRPGGVLPSWVQRRFDLAMSVPGEPLIIPLSAATTHRPLVLDQKGFPVFEASAGAHYILQHGISESRVRVEMFSWDTIGNAYFSRMLHAEPACLRRLLIVTSDWHMPRTKLAFDWVYGLTPDPVGYQVEYRAAEDPEMDEQSRAERTQKEQAGAESLRLLTTRIHMMPQFHRWLFTQHKAYKPQGGAFGEANLNQDALASY